jgi:alpha-galactosidase
MYPNMKKYLFMVLLLISASITRAEQVVIQTKNSTMVLNVEGNKQPQYVYYGTKLSAFDLANL